MQLMCLYFEPHLFHYISQKTEKKVVIKDRIAFNETYKKVDTGTTDELRIYCSWSRIMTFHTPFWSLLYTLFLVQWPNYLIM